MDRFFFRKAENYHIKNKWKSDLDISEKMRGQPRFQSKNNARGQKFICTANVSPSGQVSNMVCTPANQDVQDLRVQQHIASNPRRGNNHLQVEAYGPAKKYIKGGAPSGGNGSKTSPWNSLSQAEASNWKQLIVLPSNVALDGGLHLYDGQEIRGEDRDSCILTNSSYDLNHYGDAIVCHDDTKVKNLTIQNTWRVGIQLQDSRNTKISNCALLRCGQQNEGTFYDYSERSTGLSGGSAATSISSFGGPDAPSTPNPCIMKSGKTVIKDCYFNQAGSIKEQDFVIVIGAGDSQATGHVYDRIQYHLDISRCEFTDISYRGIVPIAHSGSVFSTKVSRCEFHDMTNPVFLVTVRASNPNFPGRGNIELGDIEVSNCEMINIRQWAAIFLFSGEDQKSKGRFIAKNNYVNGYGSRPDSPALPEHQDAAFQYGSYSTAIGSVKFVVHDNTIIDPAGIANGVTAYVQEAEGTVEADIRGNTIVGPTSAFNIIGSAVFVGESTLTITNPSGAAGEYSAGYAKFGPLNYVVSGNIVPAEPLIACSPLTNSSALAGNIALIKRGVCAFTTKVLNAQNAGAIAAIIFSDGRGVLNMGGMDSAITIPSILISTEDGALLNNLPGLYGTIRNISIDIQSTGSSSWNIVNNEVKDVDNVLNVVSGGDEGFSDLTVLAEKNCFENIGARNPVYSAYTFFDDLYQDLDLNPSYLQVYPFAPYSDIIQGFKPFGQLSIQSSAGPQIVSYTGIDYANARFTGISGGTGVIPPFEYVEEYNPPGTGSVEAAIVLGGLGHHVWATSWINNPEDTDGWSYDGPLGNTVVDLGGGALGSEGMNNFINVTGAHTWVEPGQFLSAEKNWFGGQMPSDAGIGGDVSFDHKLPSGPKSCTVRESVNNGRRQAQSKSNHRQVHRFRRNVNGGRKPTFEETEAKLPFKKHPSTHHDNPFGKQEH